MIFADDWEVLVLNFSVMGNTVFFSGRNFMERWYLFGLFELSMIFQDLRNMVFCAVFYDAVHFSISLKDKKTIESCFHKNHPDVFCYAGCCCYWLCCFISLDISLFMIFSIIPHSFLSHFQFYPDGVDPFCTFSPNCCKETCNTFISIFSLLSIAILMLL